MITTIHNIFIIYIKVYIYEGVKGYGYSIYRQDRYARLFHLRNPTVTATITTAGESPPRQCVIGFANA